MHDRLAQNPWRRFLRDRRANFGILAAVLAVPLVMGAGIAVDYSNVLRLKSELQQSLDSAALAVAREGQDVSDYAARKVAVSFLASNLSTEYSNLDIDRKGSSVTLTATVPADMAFGGLFGYSDMPVKVSSTADIAYSSYEIGLVLDTTGSMKGGKMKAMQEAVLGLIDDLSSQVSDPERLKFSLVPFATFVNVGPENGPSFKKNGKVRPGTGADWLDIKGKSTIPQLELQPGVSRFEAYHRLGKEWGGCVETREASGGNAYDTADLPARKGDKASLFIPAFAIDEPGKAGYQNDYIPSDVDPLDKSPKGKIKKLLKYGLGDVLDEIGLGGALDPLLGGDEDEEDGEGEEDGGGGLLGGLLGGLDDGLGTVSADYSGGKGPNNGCRTQPITPLTSDYQDLKDKVKALEADGTTNIMEGVAWGMRALSPGKPFSEGSDDKPGLEKIMIVLTDGANNFGNRSTALGSSYSSFGYLVDGRLGVTAAGSSMTNQLMNEKTLEACTNAKDAGMAVYTIRLEEPDVKTGTMLEQCASGAENFFDAPSRSDLKAVFGGIGDAIVRLRISS